MESGSPGSMKGGKWVECGERRVGGREVWRVESGWWEALTHKVVCNVAVIVYYCACVCDGVGVLLTPSWSVLVKPVGTQCTCTRLGAE